MTLTEYFEKGGKRYERVSSDLVDGRYLCVVEREIGEIELVTPVAKIVVSEETSTSKSTKPKKAKKTDKKSLFSWAFK